MWSVCVDIDSHQCGHQPSVWTSCPVIEAKVQTGRDSEASSSCYTLMLGNCCFMWIGSRLESNDFTDSRFSDRIGFFSYFRVLLRKDLPETTGNQATVEASSGGGLSNEDEEVGGAKKGAGRATEEGVGETTGAGRDTEEEAGAGVEGTGRATDEKSLRAGTAKISPKRRIQERVRLNIVQYKKVVSSIFWLQLTLVACYAPFLTVSILRHTVLSGKTVYGLWLFTATLVYLNSSLNPYLYCWKIKEVRMAVKNTAKAFCYCL